MTYTPTIYDWRYNVAPIDQVFRAGGFAVAGGMTLGGASISNPEPGGRAELVMNFAPMATAESNLDVSWTISRIMNGGVLRIPLYLTVQLVASDLLDAAALASGIPWDNDGPWDNEQNWSYMPASDITAAAAKGATSFTADLADIGEVLQIGHVVGFSLSNYDFAHTVMDIEYDESDVATVTISPPLRRALTTDDQVLYRPTMLATCANASEVMSNFQSGRHMALNTARFVEALV